MARCYELRTGVAVTVIKKQTVALITVTASAFNQWFDFCKLHLEQWVEGKMYDRFGLDDQTYNILGIDVPSIVVPVRPGRSLPIILEIAAMNHRQKKMGYNTAAELEKKLLEQFGEQNEQ